MIPSFKPKSSDFCTLFQTKLTWKVLQFPAVHTSISLHIAVLPTSSSPLAPHPSQLPRLRLYLRWLHVTYWGEILTCWSLGKDVLRSTQDLLDVNKNIAYMLWIYLQNIAWFWLSRCKEQGMAAYNSFSQKILRKLPCIRTVSIFL